ncbi:MAG: Fe-S cluster assembly sulfur transfer protein SufU [Gammaproteobacteria bacterium]
MSAYKELYQQVILDHNKKPRNFGDLANANRQADGYNPLCGDRIHVSLHLDGDRIESIAFNGESCAICKASSSMMTASVKGKTVAEAETLIKEFRDMTTGKLDAEQGEHHLGKLTVFSGISELPSRVKCAVLPWHTLHSAIEASGAATTEGTADPVQAG